MPRRRPGRQPQQPTPEQTAALQHLHQAVTGREEAEAAEEQALAAAYQSGARIDDIADKLGLGRTATYNRLRSAGITPDRTR